MLRRTGLVVAAALAVGAGCSADDDEDDRLVVFAAASLAGAFEEIAAEFEAQYPQTDVVLSTGGSSTIVAQVIEGAPADVVATADTSTMQRLVDAGLLADAPTVFARNRPTVVVAPGNPLGIRSVADLADPAIAVLTCAPEVPCGAYAAAVFDAAGVTVTPVSLEANVAAVVNKVGLGEADAGIAYVTDVAAAAGRVDAVPIVDNVDADAPIAVVAQAAPTDDPRTGDAPTDAADRFVDLVLGPTGRAILADAGFEEP